MVEEDLQKLKELLKQTRPYSEEDIAELRRSASGLTHSGMDVQAWAQVRSSVELLDAIRRFDRGSSRLMWATIVISAFALVVALVALRCH